MVVPGRDEACDLVEIFEGVLFDVELYSRPCVEYSDFVGFRKPVGPGLLGDLSIRGMAYDVDSHSWAGGRMCRVHEAVGPM